MAVKFQGGKAVVYDSTPDFMRASTSVRQNLMAVYNGIPKMMDQVPREFKNDPAFDKMDQAFKLFDQALKQLEQKVSGSSSHWTGK